MRSSSLRVVAAIAAVLCSAPAIAQRTMSHIAPGEAAPVTVRARVVGPDGAPVAGAMVFTDAGGSGISDARGEVTFTIEQRLGRVGARVTAVGLIGTENGVGGAGAHLAEGEIDAGTITLQLDGECRPAWLPMFGGMPAGPNSAVTAVVAFDDGSGPAVYIAGEYWAVGQQRTHSVAKWDGERWSAVGDLKISDDVYELRVFDLGDGPKLYAGGFFRQLGEVEDPCVARWTGETWEAVGEGLEAPWGVSIYRGVRALEVIDEGNGPTLVALGGFQIFENGSFIGRGAAKLVGEQWLRLGSFALNANVQDSLVFDDGAGPRLFVVGEGLLGQSSTGILRWNGTHWESFGDFRAGDRGYSLAAFDDGNGPALYVGGSGYDFFTPLRDGLARWDGQSTTPIPGLETEAGIGVPLVLDLIAFEHDGAPALIAAGQFAVTGESTTNIAAWNGKTWSSLGGASTGSDIYFAAFDEGDGEQLIAAGRSFSPPGLRGLHIASWDGASWSALGNGAIEPVQALASYDDGSGSGLYAAGEFLNADSTRASTVARWDGGAWRLLGGLFRTRSREGIRAIVGFDDGSGPAIFAAGEFILPGEEAPTVLTKWDGAQWVALGAEFSGVATSLAVFDDGSGPALYIGGDFEPIGAAVAPCIARWTGAALAPVDGLQGAVEALAVFDDGSGPNLYAGGQVRVGNNFTLVGIGRWDGAAWTTAGNSLPGDRVLTLAAFEQDGSLSLFAGGLIEEPIGSVVARNIIRWDGAAWNAIGPAYEGAKVGANGAVNDLEVFNNGTIPALYVAGSFSVAGDKSAPGIARWTGDHWTVPWFESVTKRPMQSHDFGDGPTLVVAGSTLEYPSGDAYIAAWQGCDGPRRIDLNLDGVVDEADIAVLVASWGACSSCVADLDGDGVVDGRDLGLLLGAW